MDDIAEKADYVYNYDFRGRSAFKTIRDAQRGIQQDVVLRSKTHPKHGTERNKGRGTWHRMLRVATLQTGNTIFHNYII